MKLLITGHHGLIGSKIFSELSKIHDVKGIDLKADPAHDLALRLPGHPAMGTYDCIIHAASHCRIREVIANPELARANVDSAHNIMEIARRGATPRVIVFSSTRTLHDDTNPYVASKKYLEEIAAAYLQCYGIDYVVIRPETVWGINEATDRVIPRWIESARHNKPLEIYGTAHKELSPLYIDDFFRMFEHVFSHFENYSGQKVNCAGQARLARDITHSIIHQFGSTSPVVFKPAELTQPQICSISDFTAEHDFEFWLQNAFSQRPSPSSIRRT